MTLDPRKTVVRSGRYYGWIVVVSCFLGTLAAFGTMYSFSVFFGEIAAEFQQTTANTSAIFSLQSFVTYAGAGLVGFWIDRVGVRRWMGLATVLVGLGLLGASQLESLLGVVFAYSIVAATGFAIVIPIAFATVPRWFGRRAGLANGIATSGTGIGIVLAPPFANALIEAFGWRQAYLGFTFAVVGCLGLAAILLADGPDAIGADTGNEFNDRNPADDDSAAASKSGVRDILLRPAFAIVFLAVLLAYVPAYVVLVFLVEFAETTGVGRAAGVFGISVIGAVSILGRNAAGIASDRFGRAFILAGCAALVGLSTAAFVFAPTPIVLLAIAVAFGIGYGGMAPLIAPLLTDLFGTENVYTLFGVTAAAWAIAGSMTPYLSGLGFDVLGSYLPVYAIGGALGVLAGLAFLLSAHLGTGERATTEAHGRDE